LCDWLESALLLLLLLDQSRDVDVHFEVDGVIVHETSVKQLLELQELGKPCNRSARARENISNYFSRVCLSRPRYG